MRRSGMWFVIALGVVGLISGFVEPGPSAGPDSSSVVAPHVTRVFYLQGIQPREAMTLLRSEVQIVQIATIANRNLIAVSDVADNVDQSETLLRRRDAVARTTEPHGPLDLRHLAENPTATRVFRIATDDMNGAVTLLRSIYQVREAKQSPETSSLSVDAAAPVLDSSEALLRELNLLVEATGARR